MWLSAEQREHVVFHQTTRGNIDQVVLKQDRDTRGKRSADALYYRFLVVGPKRPLDNTLQLYFSDFSFTKWSGAESRLPSETAKHELRRSL